MTQFIKLTEGAALPTRGTKKYAIAENTEVLSETRSGGFGSTGK